MKNISTWQIGVKARKENQRMQSKWRWFLLCHQEAIAKKSTGNSWWLGNSLFSLSCETKNVSKAQLRELQESGALMLRTSRSVISWLPCLLSASLLSIRFFFFYFDNGRAVLSSNSSNWVLVIFKLYLCGWAHSSVVKSICSSHSWSVFRPQLSGRAVHKHL